jgi:pimeloyl-ACP methyl ester carboxylesterase
VSRIRYADSGTVRIAYELRGALHWRRPWLVLIQGMGLDRLGWEPVLRKLRRRFRLVLVDNRGVGHSGRPAGSFTLAEAMARVTVPVEFLLPPTPASTWACPRSSWPARSASAPGTSPRYPCPLATT